MKRNRADEHFKSCNIGRTDSQIRNGGLHPLTNNLLDTVEVRPDWITFTYNFGDKFLLSFRVSVSVSVFNFCQRSFLS